MKILQICKKVPWPLTDGESIAVYGIAMPLIHEGHAVDLLAMNTAKHHRDENEVRVNLSHYRSVYTSFVNNNLNINKLIANLFSKYPIHIDRLRSADFEQLLAQVLSEYSYDIILLETVYPAFYIPLIRHFSSAKIIIRCHNVEHMIWQRQSAAQPFWKRWYYHLQSERIKWLEEQMLAKVDVVLPMSLIDEASLRILNHKITSQVIPIGLDLSKYAPRESKLPISPSDHISLCFIGTLDWAPNLDGIEWFLKEVWPVIIDKIGNGATLHIAGRHTPQSLYRYTSSNLIIHGEVDDAQSFISQHDAMIVPLLSGSGQRVKILEAMALGKTVISTPVGIEGISAVDGVHYHECRTPDDFISIIDSTLGGGTSLSSEVIRQYIVEHHEAHKSIESLLKIL